MAKTGDEENSSKVQQEVCFKHVKVKILMTYSVVILSGWLNI